MEWWYSVIEAKRLSKVYGHVVALKDFDFVMQSNEVCLLLGPNGSGKSTFIDIVGGLRKATSGKISVFNLDPWKHRRRLLGKLSVLSDGSRVPYMRTVGEFLGNTLEIVDEDEGYLRELCKRLEVDFLDMRGFELSAGMQKKVLLIAALLGHPKMVVLDEPFVSLDEKSRRVVVDIIMERKEEGLGTLVSTHNPFIFNTVAERVDRIYVIQNGLKLFEGTPEELAAYVKEEIIGLRLDLGYSRILSGEL